MSLSFDIRIRFGQFSLTAAGETGKGITAVFGPSGSGKTTLLNCLAGVVKPDKGTIVVGGDTLFCSTRNVNLPPEKRRIGYVFQDATLFPHLTGMKNILYGYDLLPSSRKVIRPEQVISLLEIETVLKRRPESMSGGERSRVAMARALLTSPRLLLLDEPLVSLDFKLKGKILPYIERINSTFDIPVLYVSHDISEVLYLADDTLVLQEGKLIGRGDPQSILGDSAVLSLAGASHIENIFPARIISRSSDTGLATVKTENLQMTFWSKELPQRENATVLLGLKAAEIVLSTTRPEAVSVRNVLPARVERIQKTGGRVIVRVEVVKEPEGGTRPGEGKKLIAEITAPAAEELGLAPGKTVFLLVKARSIRLMGEQPG